MIEESKNKVVGSGSMPFDKEYAQWIAELAKRYRSSQIKASIKVNDEMLRFYWSVIRTISIVFIIRCWEIVKGLLTILCT